MTSEKHTPIYAKEYDTVDSGRLASVHALDGTQLARHLAPEYAAFIVRAVNSHEALLEAAQHIMAEGQATEECPLCHEAECECWTELGAAIAKAEGRTA